MAEIGNLSVRLSLDANNFNGSIRQSERTLKSMQAELKAVKDKGNEYGRTVEGMKEKQDVLNRATTAAGTKLQLMRQEYDKLVQSGTATERQLADQANKVNKAQGEYNRLERELKEVTEQLKQQTSVWQKASSQMEKAGDSISKVGEKMKATGQNMSTYVTAPLVALGAIAVSAAKDFDGATASIQTELGVTAEEAERLNKVAKNVWKDGFGDSLGEAALNVANVTKSLGELSDVDLTYATEALQVFQSKGWGDTRESLRAVKVLMEQFGLSSKQAFDYLTRGFQENLDYSGEFLDTISEYSIYFSELGFDVEDMFSKLKAGADAGVFQLDKVGDAVKELWNRVTKDDKPSQDALEKLGLNAKKVKDEFAAGGKTAQKAFSDVVKALLSVEDQQERNTISNDIFGTQFEDVGKKGFEAMLQVSGGLKDVEGAAGKVSKVMEKTFSQRITRLWRESKTALQPLGEVMLDIAEDILPKLSKGISDASKWLSNLSPETQANIVKFTALAAAAGPAVVAIGGLASGIGGLMKVGGSLLGMLGRVGGAGLLGSIGGLSLTGPVGWAIAGVAALTAGIVLLNSGTKESIEQTRESLKAKDEELTANENLVSSFEKLQNQNKLTTDEMLRYLDIQTELKEAKSEEAIAKLTEEQQKLLEKSGLTNEQMNEFVRLNNEIVEKAPAAAKAISEQGNAYAAVIDEVKNLNAIERERYLDNAKQALIDATREQADLLQEQADIQSEIKSLESERNSTIQEQLTTYDQIEQSQKRINELEKQKNDASSVQQALLDQEIDKEKTLLQNGKLKIDGLDKEIGKLDKKIGKKKDSLTETNKELKAYDKLKDDYAQLILSEQGIVAEKGKAVEAVQKEQNEINRLRAQYQEKYRLGQMTSEQLREGNGILDQRQTKLNTATTKMGEFNTLAGQTIFKDVNVRTNPTIESLNRSLGMTVNKAVQITQRGAAGVQLAYADGTSFHPGGKFLAGEEGFELGRMGNKWDLLNFGVYNKPAGYKVYTHEETLRLLQAANRSYATGASSPGEASRIVNNINKRNNSRNEKQPIIIQMVTPDKRVLAEMVADDVTEIQEFNQARRRTFEGGR